MKQLLVIAYLFLVSGVTQAYNGSVAAVHFQKDIPTESVSHYYSYDADGRLISSEVALVEAGETVRNQLATYAYNLDGSLKNTHLPHANEQQDYRYTAEGWLKGVNKIEEVMEGSNKSFAYQLAYYPEDYTEYNNGLSTALASADGDFTSNIGAMQWKSRMPDIITESDAPVYSFTYDTKYQLTGATWGALENNAFVPSTTQAYNVSGLNYDPNGNIQFLERKDIDGATKHHLQYNYEGIDNRLTSVTNYGTYDYDVIGRLETATKVGESPINYGYNSDGLLATITAPSTQINFAYDEAYRIKKENTQTGEVAWYVRDINGNLLAIYSDATTQKEVPLYGSNRVGMYQRQGKVYRYELKDHLGNVRVVINKTGTNTPLVETTKDYYPFGSLLRQAGIGYRYGYQGDYAEDETDEFGLNSFMLRYYDPVLGRWLTPDPMRQFYSAYLAMGNNPVNFTDPTGGECPECPAQGTFQNGDQTYTYDGSEGVTVADLEYWGWTLSETPTQSQSFSDAVVDFEADVNSFFNNTFNNGFLDWSEGSQQNLAEVFASFHPWVSGMNAYYGYTGGKDIHGNTTSNTDNTLNAISAIPVVGNASKVTKSSGSVFTIYKIIRLSNKTVAVSGKVESLADVEKGRQAALSLYNASRGEKFTEVVLKGSKETPPSSLWGKIVYGFGKIIEPW